MGIRLIGRENEILNNLYARKETFVSKIERLICLFGKWYNSEILKYETYCTNNTLNMTRKEEIMNTIDAVFPILSPNNGRTYEQALMATGFEKGANWADKHPINVWHDASEVPQGPYIVLCDGLDSRQWVVEWLYIDMSYANWQDYVERIDVSRWAYISDLLPKGGRK